jgi:Peptidase inhibitor family I36
MMRRISTTWCVLGVLTFLVVAEATAQPRWGRPSLPREGACFYRDRNYRGDYFCTDQDIAVLPNGMNDQITSIRTFGNAEVTIYQEGRFRGRSTQLRGDVRNVGDSWNDRISSVRVRGTYGGPGAYRPDGGEDRDRDRGRDRQQRRWTDREAEAMVARAYRALLGREPDPASRGWVDQVKSNNWSEQQLMDEIKKSPEYIAKHRRERQ